MVIGIKKYLKDKKVKKRRSLVSDVRLKNLILKSNKKEVVDFALGYIQEGDRYVLIKNMITESENYICPINSREYLETIYDFIYEVSRRKYPNKEADKYSISLSSQLKAYPFDMSQFIKIIFIDGNYISTNEFFVNPLFEDEATLSIELLVNSRVVKADVNIPIDKIVGLSLLQVAYMQEFNNYWEEFNDYWK
jgi:hypothetical protein